MIELCRGNIGNMCFFFLTETTCVFVSKASSEPLGGSMAWPFDWASFWRKMMAINGFQERLVPNFETNPGCIMLYPLVN